MIYAENIAQHIGERRSAERTKAVLPVQLRYIVKRSPRGRDSELIGKTANVSQTGACLILNGPVQIASEINLHVDLPPHYRNLVGNENSHRIKAHVIWTTPTSDKARHFRCGIHFLDPQGKDTSIINRIISVEREQLSKRAWKTSHPASIFPTLPLSSPLLDDLQPSALSVDVTNACNLRCKHCFWDSYDEELSRGTNENIIDSVKEALTKYPTITNITWYGGEPLISKKTIALIQQGLRFKKNNLVITNGTFSIPEWRSNVHFGISLDGTQKIHDKLRGVNAYNKIKRNIFAAKAKDIRIFLLYCINAINIDCLPDFLAEWGHTTGLSGIGFTTYTPILGKPSYLTLSDRQRDTVVSVLTRMKKKYGKLICNTEAMIELIRSKYGEEMAHNCQMNVFNTRGKANSLHMCNDGSIRVPCALGKNADHVHCRSITKVALYAGRVLRDKDSLRTLLRMYHSKPQL